MPDAYDSKIIMAIFEAAIAVARQTYFHKPLPLTACYAYQKATEDKTLHDWIVRKRTSGYQNLGAINDGDTQANVFFKTKFTDLFMVPASIDTSTTTPTEKHRCSDLTEAIATTLPPRLTTFWLHHLPTQCLNLTTPHHTWTPQPLTTHALSTPPFKDPYGDRTKSITYTAIPTTTITWPDVDSSSSTSRIYPLTPTCALKHGTTYAPKSITTTRWHRQLRQQLLHLIAPLGPSLTVTNRKMGVKKYGDYGTKQDRCYAET